MVQIKISATVVGFPLLHGAHPLFASDDMNCFTLDYFDSKRI
jgi:hypothetical protein